MYIANVLKCRHATAIRGDKILACQPYLRQQIAWQQPAVIVALGRFAAQTLLDTEASIGSLQQRCMNTRACRWWSAIAAYLFAHLPDKAKAWQDLPVCLPQG